MFDYHEEKKKQQTRSDNIYMASAAVLIVALFASAIHYHKLEVHEELAALKYERHLERWASEVELQTLLNKQRWANEVELQTCLNQGATP
tara:strand:- start:207 stop:476 length:270 start_codon:yes stop_codon:yes gene_type:complete